jgi:hypothetical protein
VYLSVRFLVVVRFVVVNHFEICTDSFFEVEVECKKNKIPVLSVQIARLNGDRRFGIYRCKKLENMSPIEHFSLSHHGQSSGTLRVKIKTRKGRTF